MAATKKARSSKTTRKRSTAKKAAAKGFASKFANKSRTGPKNLKGISLGRGSASTAPVVYQTLRERIDAVDTNVGSTENLSDFLESTGW